MPYTRNTRIKKIEHKHSVEYVAEVEYKYPILGISCWIEFEKSCGHPVFGVFYPKCLPYKSFVNCCWDDSLEDVEELGWAKALIDEYHKLYDESEWKPKVSYIKYP